MLYSYFNKIVKGCQRKIIGISLKKVGKKIFYFYNYGWGKRRELFFNGEGLNNKNKKKDKEF